jgi:hypothetical protein
MSTTQRGCGWNNHRGHPTYRSGCPYCAAVAGVEKEARERQAKKTETMVHLLGEEQISSVLEDLNACRLLGTKSVMLVVTDEEHTKRMAAALGGDQGTMASEQFLDVMPEPDVVTVTTVWTVGMGATVEQVLEVVKAWGGQ